MRKAGNTRPSSQRRGERGAVALMAAIVMSLLIGFFALAMNVGIMMESRGQLQNASDAAALAAARALNGQASGISAARQAAWDYSQKHSVYGAAVVIDPMADVLFGQWHFVASECVYGDNSPCFEPIDTSLPRKITSIKIKNGRDGGLHNNPIPLPFGAFLGATTATVRSSAVAVGAGSADVNCSLPLAVAECTIVDSLTNNLRCGPSNKLTMVMSNANDDNVGYANLTSDSNAPNETWSAGFINGNKMCGQKVNVGSAKLQNGNDLSKVADALRGVTSGNCILGQPEWMVVTDAGCPGNPIFQGTQNAVGFVGVTIWGVSDNHGVAYGCADGSLAAPNMGGVKNAMLVEIACSTSAGTGEYGGGRSYNSSGATLRLVQ